MAMRVSDLILSRFRVREARGGTETSARFNSGIGVASVAAQQQGVATVGYGMRRTTSMAAALMACADSPGAAFG
jgi:hypothetical protein